MPSLPIIQRDEVARAEAKSHAGEHGFDAPVTGLHGKSLFEYALRLGDDALILGQRLSAWTGRCPTIVSAGSGPTHGRCSSSPSTIMCPTSPRC